jgi:hypothetical protein
MSERLDEMLGRLAAAPIDQTLDNLDAEIGRGILLRRREARTTSALAPVRVASVALALAMGLSAGGAVATMARVASPAYGLLSSAGYLAPSTLLEGAR